VGQTWGGIQPPGSRSQRFASDGRMGKDGLGRTEICWVALGWVSEKPWRHSPHPSLARLADISRVASALKCNLKRNKGSIHLCLKTVLSRTLLWHILPAGAWHLAQSHGHSGRGRGAERDAGTERQTRLGC